MDMISSLPDDTICHILSFLQIKEAALTSVLSKRWRNLFAFTPDLDLGFVDYNFYRCKGNGSFIRFVDRVLAGSGGSDHTIRTFSLRLRQSVGSDHINRWMINVLTRGILDLALDSNTIDVITLPLQIFSCNTIVKLKLKCFISIPTVPTNALSLPALKTLFLDCIRFSGYTFEALLSACPVLEDLTVLGDPWNWELLKQSHGVSSPTLKRFILKCNAYRAPDVSRTITFDTPNLAYLEYRDYVADEYQIVNLNSLVEAKLSFCYESFNNHHDRSNPANLIEGLRNVEILELSSHKTSEVFYSFREAIPLFENLSRLSIATEQGWCWKLVPLLLKRTPNLETLVINGSLHRYNEFVEEGHGPLCGCLSEYSFLSSCSAKVLEITKYLGTKGELKQMKLILEKSQCLELVKIHACAKTESSFATDLLRLPNDREIQLKFFPFTK